MAAPKRERKKAGRQARLAAERAAARRRAVRRRITLGVLAVAGVALLAFLISLTGDDDDGTDVASQNTTTSIDATGTESAAGKPCVPVADPLPSGAPAVPVKVGPPPTELVKEDLKPGTGATVTPGAAVTVNYIGVACSTGKIFDSSYSRGQPATFSLTGVIKGWTDGIPGMQVGGQRLLGIPADQAYGATGSGANIGPNEPLWFVVEVLDSRPA
ncbi:MAG: FKBP-type peptidyl-prolyl cis-trans isomerase [Acidimicrobiia bacterium]